MKMGNEMKKRVVVAMSGGVDSSVAACLLKQKGFEVIGMTICFNLPDSNAKKPSCCGLRDIEDARRVAHTLGIKHYVVNLQKELEEKIIEDFCHEYFSGRTPNPCVRCNQYIKFGTLLKKALSLDAQFLATGHYARIVQSYQLPDPPLVGTPSYQYYLRKAKDAKKDQTYFLYRLHQEQLKRLLFPVGNYTKEEVRKLARKFKLSVAQKLDSQEICFLPDTDYRAFLQRRLNTKMNPGLITDKNGRVLGKHKGIAFYTIGQRQGLGIAAGYPVYVIEIDALNNKVIIGRKRDAYGSEFMVKEASFIDRKFKNKIVADVKIRYNHQGEFAEITPCKNKFKVRFKKPQFAITPGQSAVFYKRDRVLGGGIIDEVLK